MRRAFCWIFCLILLLATMQPVLAAENYLKCPKSVKVTVGKSKAISIKCSEPYFEVIVNDESIATYQNGKIKGLKAGKTKITVSAKISSEPWEIKKTISVSVVKKSKKKTNTKDDTPEPIQTFELPANIKNSLMPPVTDAAANESADGTRIPAKSFATTDLVIRDDGGERLGVLKALEVANYLGEAGDNRADIVTAGGLAGNVSSGSLIPYAESAAAAATATGSANVRLGPGMEYDVCGSLAGGDSVSVLAKDKNWSLVNANGAVGYVANRLLAEAETDAHAADAPGSTVAVDLPTVTALPPEGSAPIGDPNMGDLPIVDAAPTQNDDPTVTGDPEPDAPAGEPAAEPEAEEPEEIPESPEQISAEITGFTDGIFVRTGPGTEYHLDTTLKRYDENGKRIQYNVVVEKLPDKNWYKIIQCDARPDMVGLYVFGNYITAQ